MAEEKDKKGNAPTEEPQGGKPTTPDNENYVQVPKEEFEGLKSKVGELGGFVDESKEFIRGSSVVITTLASDPELSKAFRAALAKQQGVVPEGQESGQQPTQGQETGNPAQGEPAKAPLPDKRIDDVVAANRGKIIADFENEVGIASMKPEERKVASQKIEGFLNDFGWSVQTAPLVTLQGSLNKAWLGIKANDLREEGKLEGFAQMRTNNMGTMPTISGGAPNAPSQQSRLTDKQKAWAEKLGVDPEKAEKTYLERDKEEKRTPPAEK